MLEWLRMVLEWCWSGLEWLGIVLEGVRGCWGDVGAAWNMLECVGVYWRGLEGVRGCWSGVGAAWSVLEGVGIEWRVLEWLGMVLEWCWGGLE